MKKKIIIIGAGISGLAAAHLLNKDGHDIIVLDSGSAVGGAMQSHNYDGFLVDYGPNSGLETTPLIRQIVDEVGLSDEMIYANENSNKRFILRNGNLHELPTNLSVFVKTNLFSAKAKFRLMAEPLIGKSDDGYYQSMSQFVTRRLGQEFLDYAIDPFVSGVFAGDPSKLSVKSAFPKLYRLEELYGGLIKGMIRGSRERKKRAEQSKQNAKMFSFLNGMQSFPKAISEKLNGKVLLNCEAVSVERKNSAWNVIYQKDSKRLEINADFVISTIPVYSAAKIFGHLDNQFIMHAQEIYYPPVMVLYLGYKKESIGRPLDGFGYLIPSKEKRTFLGAIWSSTIFIKRCFEDVASFTLFVGGARSPQIFEMDKHELIEKVINEFEEIMKINGSPVILKEKVWEKAIPQYNLGYIEHENYFDKFERENSGLVISGNFRGGISVGDCVKNAGIIVNKIV